MNPLQSYKQQQALGWTRIEMLLALYRGAIDRLEQAVAAMQRGDSAAAKPMLVRAQRMIMELMAGVDLQYGDIPRQLIRLYEYVLWQISLGTTQHVQSALEVLKTLWEGLEAIRDEAQQLERNGKIPPAGSGSSLLQSA